MKTIKKRAWLLGTVIFAGVLYAWLNQSLLSPDPTSDGSLAKEPGQRTEPVRIHDDERQTTTPGPSPATKTAVNEDQPIGSDDMPPTDEETLSLWQTSDDEEVLPGEEGLPGYEGLNTTPVQVDLDMLSNLQVGQQLELHIPQANAFYFGQIQESHSELGGKVQAWSGDLNDGEELTGFTITQGKRMTFVVVSAASGTYQIDIDNESGNGVVVDMREFAKFHTPDDAVIYEGSPIPESVITPKY
jgi:hypothetical protein